MCKQTCDKLYSGWKLLSSTRMPPVRLTKIGNGRKITKSRLFNIREESHHFMTFCIIHYVIVRVLLSLCWQANVIDIPESPSLFRLEQDLKGCTFTNLCFTHSIIILSSWLINLGFSLYYILRGSPNELPKSAIFSKISNIISIKDFHLMKVCHS